MRFTPFSAEKEGFEPPVRCRTTVFKTAAFDHSAISPNAKVQRKFDLERASGYEKEAKHLSVSLPLALILLYFLLSFFPSEKALPTAEPISTYRLCIGSKVMRCSFVISGLPSSARKASSHSTFTTSAMR